MQKKKTMKTWISAGEKKEVVVVGTKILELEIDNCGIVGEKKRRRPFCGSLRLRLSVRMIK